LWYFGGIVGTAHYCGCYNWNGAESDLLAAEFVKTEYNLSYHQIMGTWQDTHYVIEEHQTILEQSDEKLIKDRVLGSEYWEGILLSHNR